MLARVLLSVVVIVFRVVLCHTRHQLPPTDCPVKVCVGECRYNVQVGLCYFQLSRTPTVDGSVSYRRYHCWLNWLLILAGDVAFNPGPARFPCTVCARPVRSNQRGIQCDRCQEWTHASCADVSVTFYEQLAAQVQFSWCCPSCLFLELPLSE